jgi:hypothetical protein
MISADEGDNTMSKTEADNLKQISTAFLKKHDYFCGYRSGTMTWTNGWSGNKSSVGIETSTMNGENYLRIHYTQTDRDTDEKKEFDYKIPLTTTPCRYGGKRYWFTCPWYKNGKYCGRRVGTLYKDGDYFACRHCYDLTYDSRKLSGYAKSFGSIVSIPELEELQAKVKRQYYRGRPTKTYQRYLKKEEKSDRAWIGMAAMLDMRTKKLGRGR